VSKDRLQFIYHFDPIRPELVTDADAWTDADNRIAADHFAYLQEATQDGIVLLAERSQDRVDPAIVIFEAESGETAREFIKKDPFVSGGLMRASLHPFRAALVRDQN